MHEQRTIQCLIADDEPPARQILCRYVESVPMLHLAGECSNAIQVMAFLQEHPVDLLFLDINMPQLKGTELLKILKHPPKVVFTTAHADYALEGYELDVVDFLLKPIQFDRFLKSVQKATQLVPLAARQEHEPALPNRQEAFVYFRADRKMVKVMLQDILYIESMKDYAKVVTTNGTIITKQSMTALEAMLPEHLFIRTHRSFIVSLQKVRSFTSELVEVDKAEIPIGKLFRQSVMRVLS